VNVTTLQTALGTNNVVVSTTGAGTDAGNITIADNLTWSSTKTLTLNANGGITGTGSITMGGARVQVLSLTKQATPHIRV